MSSKSKTAEQKLFAAAELAFLQATERHWQAAPPRHLSRGDVASMNTILARCGETTPTVITQAFESYVRFLRKKIADVLGVESGHLPSDCRLGLLADHIETVLQVLDEMAHVLKRPA